MDIKLIAAILLLGRLTAVFFMLLVLRKQWRLLRLPIDPDIKTFRLVLFIMCAVILTGNFVPIAIDAATLFGGYSGRANPSSLGVLYAFSNCTTAIVSAVLIWLMYRIAAKDRVAVVKSDSNEGASNGK